MTKAARGTGTMVEPRPRNWKAMRADRVLAMAENRFGKQFASKDAAIAALSKLPPAEQRRMRKPMKTGARNSDASKRMIAGMSGASVRSIPNAAQTASQMLISGMSKVRGPLALVAVAGAGMAATATVGSDAMAADKKKIKERQQLLRDAGFDVAVDGIEGSTTRNAWSEYQTQQKALVDQAKAKAEVERAKTDLRRLELEAEARRERRQDDRRAADKAPVEQLRQIGMVAVPLAAGMMYGKAKADKINAEVQKAAKAKNKQLDKVAAKVRGASDPARLKAGVRVADKLKLAKTKGPVGAITAGFLATEAVAARVISAHTENETASEMLNGAAIGLGAAAVSTVGTRMVQRATSSVMPNASSLVDVETAREALNKKVRAPAKGSVSKIGSAAARVALPVIAGIAAVSAFNEGAAAAEADGESSLGKGSTEAAKAVTDVLSFGAGEATERALAGGASPGEAIAVGMTKGAVNFATFGVADMANEALADKGGVSGVISDTVTKAAGKLGEALGWSAAARDASAEARGVAKAGAASDRVGDALSVANGAAGLVMGMIMMSSAKEPGVGRLARGMLRAGGAASMVAGGVVLADTLLGGEKSGKAYLNEAAERKAAQVDKAPKPVVIAASAMPIKPDGQTAGYTRRGRDGGVVRVSAYRTPDRRR